MTGSYRVCSLVVVILGASFVVPLRLRCQAELPRLGHEGSLSASSSFTDPPPIGHPGLRTSASDALVSLPQMVRAAGTIFAGTVTEISHHPAGNRQPIETVQIKFRVEQSIRGAVPGATMTISEWVGAWYASQSYRVGDRFLLFLYPPSKLGLTSCVDGTVGRFPIDPVGRVAISARQLDAFRSDPVLGGKSRLRFSDFALAVGRVSEDQ